MSTEHPKISNFLGLDAIQDLLDGASLKVEDNGQTWDLTAMDNELQCDEDAIPKLGLSMSIPVSVTDLLGAISEAGLESEQVNLVIVAEDPFLKEREILINCSINSDLSNLQIAARGGRRVRALQNSREGLRIEAHLVLNQGLVPEPGKPHREGTKLASIRFRIRGLASSGGINPVELTPEVIRSYGLSRKTQLFIELKGDLLGSESVADSVIVYVDADLLRALKARRSGLEYDYLGTSLAVSALQQIVFMLSAELRSDTAFSWDDEDIPVLAFVREKLNEISRVGHEKLSKSDTLHILREQPHVASSMLTGLLNMSRDARKLVVGSLEEGD